MFARYLRKQQEIRSESDHQEINTGSRTAERAGERTFALTAQSQGSFHRQLVAEIFIHSPTAEPKCAKCAGVCVSVRFPVKNNAHPCPRFQW